MHVTPSKHAADRWRERTPPDSTGLITAWQKAHPITHARSYFNANPDHGTSDEIRVYHGVTSKQNTEYVMLLFRRNSCIVTTYEYTGVHDHLIEAYLDELVETTTYYESTTRTLSNK